jgi:hypothetical protein
MKALAMQVVRSSVSLSLLRWGLRCYSYQENAVDLSFAACQCHHCVAACPLWPCCHFKGVMSKHFAIDMELFHLYLHLQNLEMGQFLEMHQPRELGMLL